MKRLLILSALSAALMTSGCITVIDADHEDDFGWHGENAQPFDGARAECRASTGEGPRSDAFRQCMAAKGWTRS
ncbi:hypothetical protein GCM10007859_25990 [Brevundimonas denitrificans]|uniref:Lipoprotein n=1 Tax=Brevundimonas denitrificans TaxID=1443434 RepID=A0ABQ6BQR8_9CAUL|nr:hypothetical protein [Brevundimonas denitrificans]GLS02572.1 hypothetical protein GCM10007859_25990 [Brevundimonas denitrificans]